MYNHSHLAPTMAIHDNSRPLPPTAYFRYQAAIVYELRQRRVQLFLPGASRWISSKWRGEDIQIKTAFWQLAEIREAEDKGKTAEDKARIKRDRRRRGGIYSCRDVLLEGSTNPEAHQLADIISAWVVKIPSPSPQELEKQTIPVTLRRTRKKEKKHPHPPTSSWPGFPTNSVQELPPDRTSQQTGTTGVPATTDLSTVDSLPLRDSPITSSTSSHCPYGYAPDLTPARPSEDKDGPASANYLTAQSLDTDGTPERPTNAFMISARKPRSEVSAANQMMRTCEISKTLGEEWDAMDAVSYFSVIRTPHDRGLHVD